MLDLIFFARALRFRWLWQEWTQPHKPWVGLGNPCDEIDRLLFAACTTVVIGDGKKASFWRTAWAQGRRPMDLAPEAFARSRGKNRTLSEALEGQKWVCDIDLRQGLSLDLLQQYTQLWTLAQSIQLTTDVEDKCVWKLNASGEYSTASAYRAQFFGHTNCTFHPLIWKPWAPQKCKIFGWLIIRNRVWTSDRLAMRGWPRNPCCLLCRQAPETAHHIMAECRYTKCVWSLIATCLSYPQVDPANVAGTGTVNEWWTRLASLAGVPKRGLRSLILLVVWEV